MPKRSFPVPHHQQEEDHTCGPASVKMVLDAIWGLRIEESNLAQHLETAEDIGTRQRVMARFMEGLGLQATVRHTDTTLDELRALAHDHVVIVCYWLAPEDTDHYAVVTGWHGDHLLLNDPWIGPETRMTWDEFDAHWYADSSVHGRRDRWLLAVKAAA